MSIGNPNKDPIGTLAKAVNYDKRALGRMVQDGRVDHAQALLAGMRIDRMRESLAQAQAPAGQQPTVLEQTFAPQPQQGLAQLTQVPQQAQQAPQQAAPVEGGLSALPIRDGMFSEESYAGGGIIAFDEGGDVPGFAGGAYLKNPVGKYFNPADLTPYDDAMIQEQLRLNPDKTMEQIRADQSKLRGEYGIKNIFDEQRTELEKDRAENEKLKEQILPMAGLKAAAALMGNTSQFFMPGLSQATREFGAEYATGQREYRATKKDIRNLGFEIGRADQTMRQAEMSGDQNLYNTERARRDGLLKQAQDVKFKNTETKNATLLEGAKAAASYDTNTAVANARARAAAKTAGLDQAKINSKVLTAAKELMAVQYPPGQFTTYFQSNPEKYQEVLSGYIKQAEEYIYGGVLPTTAPGAKPQDKTKDAAKANPVVNPSASTKATIAGKKTDPKLQYQSLLDKYPAAGSRSTEDEDE
jgi:hypothetical protein